MKALTWHGKRDVRVENVPDPTNQEPTDAIIRVTSSGLCGSDLHLYRLFGPFMDEGDQPRSRRPRRHPVQPLLRFLFLSDVLSTAWLAVEYAQIPAGGSVAPRVARHRGAEQVFVPKPAASKAQGSTMCMAASSAL